MPAEEPETPAATVAIAAGALVVAAILVRFGLAARRRRAAQPVATAPATPAPAPGAEQSSTAETLSREVAELVSGDVERAAAVLGRWIAREA